MIAELHYPDIFYQPNSDKVKYNTTKAGYFMMQINNKAYRDIDPGIIAMQNSRAESRSKMKFFYPLKISLGIYYDMDKKLTTIMITPLMITNAFSKGTEAILTNPNEINSMRNRPHDKILFHQHGECLIYSPYHTAVEAIIDTVKSLMAPGSDQMHKSYTDLMYKLYDAYKRIRKKHGFDGINIDSMCESIDKQFVTAEKIAKKALGTTFDNESKVALKMLQGKLYSLAVDIESLFLYK
jgi:hypothetical protein